MCWRVFCLHRCARPVWSTCRSTRRDSACSSRKIFKTTSTGYANPLFGETTSRLGEGVRVFVVEGVLRRRCGSSSSTAVVVRRTREMWLTLTHEVRRDPKRMCCCRSFASGALEWNVTLALPVVEHMSSILASGSLRYLCFCRELDKVFYSQN